ncbi:MAG: helix-turn-helix transcriptional regulator [Cyclobacteriaceae bacterium]
MSRKGIGEFEELVLLAIAILHKEAYGVVIKEEITQRSGRKVSIGALQTAFRRMEDKGYLKSYFGEATAVRGGKRKKYYELTGHGSSALQQVRELRQSMWSAIPATVLKNFE